jgi:hypothetical protein
MQLSEPSDPLLAEAMRAILTVRGHRVLLDVHLAAMYGVEPRSLVQAVMRNRERFPEDFAFRLTRAEAAPLKSVSDGPPAGRGGRRVEPYAFTEQGVAMLSSVLRSPRAVQVNVAIMRAFVHLRQLLLTNAELTRKLEELEQRYDAQFKVVFDAIRELMNPDSPPPRRIGFRHDES